MYPGTHTKHYFVLGFALSVNIFMLQSFSSAKMGLPLRMGASFIISSGVAFLYFRFGGWRKNELFSAEG